VLVIRKDEQGSDIWDFRKNQSIHIPAYPTKVADVVGAGNTFCGAFVVTIDQGIKIAGTHGSATASYMVEQVGIPNGLPNRNDYHKRFDSIFEGIASVKT
jgi:sugar/nucleoside kinase (ribokinase family)